MQLIRSLCTRIADGWRDCLAAEVLCTDPALSTTGDATNLIQQTLARSRAPRKDFDLLAICQIVGQSFPIAVREGYFRDRPADLGRPVHERFRADADDQPRLVAA